MTRRPLYIIIITPALERRRPGVGGQSEEATAFNFISKTKPLLILWMKTELSGIAAARRFRSIPCFEMSIPELVEGLTLSSSAFDFAQAVR